MRFIQLSGFTVKPDKAREFQQWVVANQDRLARTYPEGTSLIGFFAAVHTSAKEAGDMFVLEELDSYGAQDALAALGRDPDNEQTRLWVESLAFIDPDPKAWGSKILLKDLVDATVFDLPAETAEAPEPVRA